MRKLLLFFILVLTFQEVRSQNFPPYEFTILDSAKTEGYYFINPYKNGPPYSYEQGHIILDRFGRMVFYRLFDNPNYMTSSVDFKIQTDGRITYFDLPRGQFVILDSTFTEVDSIWCANGYETDQHDIQITDEGHYLLFGTEVRIMNLTAYHYFGIFHNQPGSANAEVSGVVIQEFDENKNLIWEWKAHDHFQFDDVDEGWLLSPSKVDWTHANAVEKDDDGNILLSMRHFNEITKISHETGDIIWRLGGKENDFVFTNDPVRFMGQHDIRRINPTTVSLFDNGERSNPSMARALEYELDEVNLTATQTWCYIQDSSLTSMACGNHQIMSNGNHLVCYGFTGLTYPWMAVTGDDKSEIVKLSMPVGYSSYRAFGYPELPWQFPRPVISCERIGSDYFFVAEEGHQSYRWSNGDTTRSVPISETGTYSVWVPYGLGFLCSDFIEVTDLLNPCVCTGTQKISSDPGIAAKCFPNPASGRINIVANIPYDTHLEISLVSPEGRHLFGKKEFYSKGNHSIPVDLTGISSGVYFLTISSKKETITEKVLVR